MAKHIETKVCGVCHTASVLTLTDAEWEALQSGALIQVALPNWSPAQREMLQTGLHPECWTKAFPKCSICDLALEDEDDNIQDPLTQRWRHNVCPKYEEEG